MGEGGASDDDDSTDTTGEPQDVAKIALLRYLESAAGHSLPVVKLKTRVATDPLFAKDAALVKTLTGLLEDPDFLKSIDEIEYNGKKGTVTLPAAE